MSSYIGAVTGIAEGAYTSTRISQLSRKQRSLTYAAMIERQKQLKSDISLRNRELTEMLGAQSAQASGQGLEVGSGNVAVLKMRSGADSREDIRELEAAAWNDVLRMYLGMQINMRAAKTKATTRLLTGIAGGGAAAGEGISSYYQGKEAKSAGKTTGKAGD